MVIEIYVDKGDWNELLISAGGNTDKKHFILLIIRVNKRNLKRFSRI